MAKLAIIPKFDVDPAFEDAAAAVAAPAALEEKAAPKFVQQMQRPRYATPEEERIAREQQQRCCDL